MSHALTPNQRWSLDFVADTFGASRKFRILAVIDAFIESFNGSLRDELLNEEIFDTLDDARRKIALWRLMRRYPRGMVDKHPVPLKTRHL